MNLPLSQYRILVTRAAGQSSQFTKLLEARGASVLEMPAIDITPPSSWVALDNAIAHLEQFDWLILTSSNGVDYFCERLAVQQQDVSALAKVKIAVVGQKTAVSLQQKGIVADFIPPDFVADSLVEHFPDRDRLPTLNILFPRVETGGRDLLVKALTAQGATVTEVAAYESGCATTMPASVAIALQQRAIEVVTFGSSKTVKCFYQLVAQLDSQPLDLLANVCVASIGPQTSVTCQELFGRVDVEAQEYTLAGLTRAIEAWANKTSG